MRVQNCEKCRILIVIKVSVKLACLSCLFNVGHSHSLCRASLIFSWKLVRAESKMEKQLKEYRFLHDQNPEDVYR